MLFRIAGIAFGGRMHVPLRPPHFRKSIPRSASRGGFAVGGFCRLGGGGGGVGVDSLALDLTFAFALFPPPPPPPFFPEGARSERTGKFQEPSWPSLLQGPLLTFCPREALVEWIYSTVQCA